MSENSAQATDSLQQIDAGQITAQLDRILASATFADSPRLQQFLNYIIAESLAGRASRIKGFTIAHDVFGRDDPEDAQVSAIVRVEAGRLRRHLDDYYSREGISDSLRITVPKGGYVPVFDILPAAAGVDRADTQIEQTAGLPSRWNSTFAVIALVLIALLVVFYRLSPEPVVTEPSLPVLQQPVLAVLPFTEANSSIDGQIALGLTEDIITDLAQLSVIDVISLTSVRGYEDRAATVAELRETLGVTHILRGSVRGDNRLIRVTTQFLDASSGKELWADRFDRTPENILDLQDEIAVRVVQALAIEVSELNRVRRFDTRNVDPEALALYRQAMNLVNPPSDRVRSAAALLSFRQVIELDPEFAGGYAGIAYVHAFRAVFRLSDTVEADVEEAKAMAAEALLRSDNFGLAYIAMAFAHLAERNFDAALEYSQRAVAASPGDAYVQTYRGVILAFAGQPEAGIEPARHALRLDPLNVRAPYLNILGTIYLHAGRYEESLDALVRNQRLGGPDSPGSVLRRATLYMLLDRESEAMAEIARLDDFVSVVEAQESWVKRSFRRQRDHDLVINVLRELAEKQGALGD